MNRTTTGLCLAALLVSCSMNSVLRADELLMRDNFFVADETRHLWVNEHNGRTGMLTVSGALLSSPCTLETNEVELPLPDQKEGIMTRYALKLKLNLLGCGDGGANQFTYWLSEAQQQATDRAQGKPYMNPRDNTALLRLRLDYE
ncbi:fimbrial protein PapJ [Escherichia coli]|uniref:pilus-assembly fibrillin subunit n=1 Tax=Escherichia coli TaxID=562 RepID=UPI0010DE8DC1|nr:pilus-assembly fibrillin subunit [Escherichia coli]GDT40112.1 fimbrial protein PapJ [Escherichia coli]